MLRIEGGQVLATLIRLTGDFDAAEDALHDAVIVAAEVWRRDGLPDRPSAWLTTVAKNKALDRIRREAQRSAREREAFTLLDTEQESLADDRLTLLFTCCHPALSAEAQVALALRTICQLSTVDIARVFLVPDATIGQRISRAKSKIARAHIPYRVPDAHELPDRLAAVLATIYSVFTVGHHATAGELGGRVDLADEAIRLGRMLVELMPDEAECRGLLALMLAANARRSTRIDATGELVLLADQDRDRWDHAAIVEASALVEDTLRRGRTGPYLIQASIASLHGLAPTYADTDWPQIAQLYALLEQRLPTSVVRVNRAVAVAQVEGPETGLALLDAIDGSSVEQWHLYWSTRAEFQKRLGDISSAIASFDRALVCVSNDTDRRFLEARRCALTQHASDLAEPDPGRC